MKSLVVHQIHSPKFMFDFGFKPVWSVVFFFFPFTLCSSSYRSAPCCDRFEVFHLANTIEVTYFLLDISINKTNIWNTCAERFACYIWNMVSILFYMHNVWIQNSLNGSAKKKKKNSLNGINVWTQNSLNFERKHSNWFKVQTVEKTARCKMLTFKQINRTQISGWILDFVYWKPNKCNLKKKKKIK